MSLPIVFGAVKSMAVPLTGIETPQRDQRVVDGQEAIGVEHQLVLEDLAAAGPARFQ